MKAKDFFTGRTCAEFYDFIRDAVSHLDENQIREELADYLPPAETQGLGLLFKAALAKL